MPCRLQRYKLEHKYLDKGINDFTKQNKHEQIGEVGFIQLQARNSEHFH